MKPSKLYRQTLRALIFLLILRVSMPSAFAQSLPDSLDSFTPGKIGLVVQKPGHPAPQKYDTGEVRIIVDSADSDGTLSLLEITEKPGYKTPWHKHNEWDESFYVLEGTLTAKVGDTTYTLPAGSFILFPRGTPHAQGNLGSVPVRLLLTISPSGFERHMKDRIELYKTVKPDNPEFPKRMDQLREKNKKHIQLLGPTPFKS